MIKKYIKKYGLPVVIVGILGKITSIILVFGVFGHWFGTLLPSESEHITIYLDPERTLQEHQLTIEDEVTMHGGHGGGHTILHSSNCHGIHRFYMLPMAGHYGLLTRLWP